MTLRWLSITKKFFKKALSLRLCRGHLTGNLGMGWLPNDPDFRGCTVEQYEVSPKLKLLRQISVKAMNTNSMTRFDLILRLTELHPQRNNKCSI